MLHLLEQQKTTKFAPGTKWAYSNSGYVVLGLIVAKVSGNRLASFCSKRIFAPLQMNNTIAYEKGKNEVTRRAYGHTRVEDAWRANRPESNFGDAGRRRCLLLAGRSRQMGPCAEPTRLLSEAEMRPALTPVMVPEARWREPEVSPRITALDGSWTPTKDMPDVALR